MSDSAPSKVHQKVRRHVASNRSSYPINPRTNENHLEHLKASDWKIMRSTLDSADIFHEKYDISTIGPDNGDKAIFRIKSKNGRELKDYAVKIYNTFGKLDKFNQIMKEFRFIRETQLMEYGKIYYNHTTHQVYIPTRLYSPSLASQINQNKMIFNREKDAKLIICELLDKLWIIHNCGYIHGDVKPHNVVKRECNDYNQFIDDGWKLINFDNMRKYKSKGEYVGTAGWSAPEMEWGSNKNKYSYSSDIFSLGLVLLFTLFGEQPLDITEEEKRNYAQNDDFFNDENKQNEGMQKHLKDDLKWKMWENWYYNKLLKSENMLKNYLVKLYYDNKISMNLFELLYDGMLVYDHRKRWNCEKIYNSKWFGNIRLKTLKIKMFDL